MKMLLKLLTVVCGYSWRDQLADITKYNFIDTGILKPTEKSQLFPDAYGRLVNVPIFKTDWDKIDYYHETDPDWIDSLEGSD